MAILEDYVFIKSDSIKYSNLIITVNLNRHIKFLRRSIHDQLSIRTNQYFRDYLMVIH